MDIESLFQSSRWELLEEVARKPQGTTELAQRLRTSPANVSQQLRQLELAGFVHKKRSKTGRVHYRYSIPKSFTYTVQLTPHSAVKEFKRYNEYENFLLGLGTQHNSQALLGFVTHHTQLIQNAQFIGVLKRGTPEFFIITQEVESIRKHHANVEVQTLEGPRRVVVWSHTLDEVEQGLTRKEHYFLNLIHEVTLFYDKEQLYSKLLEQTENNT